MVRVTNAVASRRKKKRFLKRAKGQFGHRSKRYRQARRSLIKGMVYEYRDRKVKKREFRNLWIARINAACREVGITYSRFISGLNEAKVNIDRKVISELAISSPSSFKKLVKVAQDANQSKAPKAAKAAK